MRLVSCQVRARFNPITWQGTWGSCCFFNRFRKQITNFESSRLAQQLLRRHPRPRVVGAKLIRQGTLGPWKMPLQTRKRLPLQTPELFMPVRITDVMDLCWFSDGRVASTPRRIELYRLQICCAILDLLVLSYGLSCRNFHDWADQASLYCLIRCMTIHCVEMVRYCRQLSCKKWLLFWGQERGRLWNPTSTQMMAKKQRWCKGWSYRRGSMWFSPLLIFTTNSDFTMESKLQQVSQRTNQSKLKRRDANNKDS